MLIIVYRRLDSIEETTQKRTEEAINADMYVTGFTIPRCTHSDIFQSHREAKRKTEEEIANAQIKAAVDLDRPRSQRRQFPGSIPSEVLESIGHGSNKGKKRQRDDDDSVASRSAPLPDGRLWEGLDFGMYSMSDSTARSSNEPDIDPIFSYAHRRKIQRLESMSNPADDESSGSPIDPEYPGFAQPSSPAVQPDDGLNLTATQVSSVSDSSEAYINAANPIFPETNSQTPQPSNPTTTATQVAEPAGSVFSNWLHAPRPCWTPKSRPT